MLQGPIAKFEKRQRKEKQRAEGKTVSSDEGSDSEMEREKKARKIREKRRKPPTATAARKPKEMNEMTKEVMENYGTQTGAFVLRPCSSCAFLKFVAM